jgi:class 3 adenylate cyclase
VETSKTHYAKTADGVHIAYQVLGDAPLDLLYVPGYISHLEFAWQYPPLARYYRRLAGFSRLILVDRRGTGMSDRVPQHELPSLEVRMDDVRAVLDEVGSDRVALFGEYDGGAMCALFAATYPSRTVGLILFATGAKGLSTPDYPWGWTEDRWSEWLVEIDQHWGTEDFVRRQVHSWFPSLSDAQSLRWYATLQRLAASPGAAMAMERMAGDMDIRHVLPAIHVPTLILARQDDELFPLAEHRFIAERIPGAQLTEVPGADSFLPWAGNQDPLLGKVERFLASVRQEEAEFDRVLATVLFTDIVGSTEKAAELGDRSWKELIERHHSTVRGLLARYRGQEVDTAGDGFLAAFDGPARAVRCAHAIINALRPLDLEIRAGLHTGECETIAGKVGGIAVNIAARVTALASSREVLASSTVKDLVAGSGLIFDDAGEHELRGVPGRWRLYRVSERSESPGRFA